MNRKVICYIQAFDCEKTIAATMQSVLEQTYQNWICVVLSNGNENKVEAPNWSYNVITGYAAKDSRFIVLNKKRNDIDMYIPTLYYIANSFPDSYICSLDADDVYKPDFFEKAVILAKKNDLDIVACGTDIVLKERAESETETLLSKRQIEHDLIIDKSEFTNKFQQYKPFFNEMWGKLYHSRLFNKEHNEQYAKRHFFRRFLPDTLFTIDNLSRASKIGILGGTYHKFYQFQYRPSSNATIVANAFAANQRRFRFGLKEKSIFSIHYTYDVIMSFLQSHGKIDDELYEYMQAILFGWFGDLYSRTLLHTTNEKNLVKLVEYLVFDENFDNVIFYNDTGKYNNLKNYKMRLEYCQRLRNMILMQKNMKNRCVNDKHNIYIHCTKKVSKRIDRIVLKLDNTIEKLLKLKEEKKNVR